MVNIINRELWDAEVAEDYEPIDEFPVAYVLLMYTKTDTCRDLESCLKTIKSIQKRQMDEGLPDIQWNFLIGGDGQVYEGRGWETRPTTEVQFYSYNNKSLDIAFIANPEEEGHVTLEMEQALIQLVGEGVSMMYIKKEHDIIREQVHKGFQG